MYLLIENICKILLYCSIFRHEWKVTIHSVVYPPYFTRGTVQVSLSRQQSGCIGVDGNAFGHVQSVSKQHRRFMVLARVVQSE